MRKIKNCENKLYRIIDANLNRAKEGLRVCEDVCRFILDDKKNTREFKDIRHRLTHLISFLPVSQVIRYRDSDTDVGRMTTTAELRRKKIADIFYANSQRVKESIRVLEEFFKLGHPATAKDLKILRYKIYALEKKVTQQF
ncbi:MAG TPA: thiamine-phosphate pyrophosphorylase [Candidatus Omnitrophota bacterium]|nr:thiamine-phosphate pyrophosphorylase [Candidatus Omnitrophota bacterium]HPN88152.1 thiamine-phosphate pyrophosphorylase [Candidatus Omnitrophota bacterium]